MMAGQSKLPKLPIPTLEDTCKRYLEQVAPLLSAAGLERTRGAVAQFLAGDGPKLQAALHEYASDKTSYVEDYWFESYLDYDASVVLNVNPFFVLADDPMPCASDMQISRAASLVISAVQFAIKLRTGELQPDTWRGSALCMQQYNYLFACARMPSEDGHDHIERHEHSQHIVVLCHGLAYYFDVLWPEGTELCLSEAQLSDNLRRIRTDADAVVAGASAEDALGGRVGVLTTDLRCEWAAARDELARSPTNLELLHVVDSALFVLCLDDDAPSEPGKVACAMLHGSYNLRDGVQCGSMTNRWYDKLQIIVCANGTAGVNFEHTRVDGHTVLRFVSGRAERAAAARGEWAGRGRSRARARDQLVALACTPRWPLADPSLPSRCPLARASAPAHRRLRRDDHALRGQDLRRHRPALALRRPHPPRASRVVRHHLPAAEQGARRGVAPARTLALGGRRAKLVAVPAGVAGAAKLAAAPAHPLRRGPPLRPRLAARHALARARRLWQDGDHAARREPGRLRAARDHGGLLRALWAGRVRV
jgi:hypothetical protein